MTPPDDERFRAYFEREIAQARALVERMRSRRRYVEVALERVRKARLRSQDIESLVRRNSKRRPPDTAPALVEPPRGPLPLQGGAAAPLEFDS